MRWVGLTFAVVGALAVAGGASAAHAQAARPKAAFAADSAATARDSFALNHSQGRQIIELDGQKRWGLKVEVQPPVTRDIQLKDMEAGAYYKVTPAIRLGGAVGLADKTAPEQQTKTQEQVTPRVKLGAMFKF